jgi:large subunit ribosomal protein L24
MHVKKGDKVKVLSGKDRGAQGVILKALPKKELVVVEGLNKVKRHQRGRRGGQKGQIIEKTMPMHVSTVKKI